MKLFGRSGGYYLFWTGAVYLTFGLSVITLGLGIPTEVVSAIWIMVLSLPFIIPPFGRWLNLDVEWDRNMWDFFKGDKNKEPSNVVPFPEPKAVPYVEPPREKEKPSTIFYRLGVTDNNRLAFNMGHSEITMNKKGVQNMIDQLTFFRDQLDDEDEDA